MEGRQDNGVGLGNSAPSLPRTSPGAFPPPKNQILNPGMRNTNQQPGKLFSESDTTKDNLSQLLGLVVPEQSQALPAHSNPSIPAATLERAAAAISTACSEPPAAPHHSWALPPGRQNLKFSSCSLGQTEEVKGKQHTRGSPRKIQ